MHIIIYFKLLEKLLMIIYNTCYCVSLQAEKETEIVLFNLYHLNTKKRLAVTDVTKKEYEIKKLETLKGKNEEDFKSKKQERAKLNQELNTKENLISKIVSKYTYVVMLGLAVIF